MTRTADAHEALRTALDGRVVTAEDGDYDDVRRVWNADIDRRPAVIAQCVSTGDVVAAVGYAQAVRLEISIRSGAHNVAGRCTGDDGLMIDLSRMRGVVVDPEARRARVRAGALLADVDAATQAYGLAVPLGAISHTGVAGLTLGGGMGWLSRQAGLTIDNLESAEVVVADGRVLRASADENPDLFWAVRGGGGNVGVVTEFEFRLHEAGPMVEFGFFFWEVERGAEALRLMRDVVGALPRSLNAFIAFTNAPPAPFVPEEQHHRPGYVLLLSGFGDPAAHAQVVDRVRAGLPPLFDFVTPMHYTELQQLLDEGAAWGFHCYEKSIEIGDFTEPVIEVLTELLPQKVSPLTAMIVYRLDEAYLETGEQDTAYGGRRIPQYEVFLSPVCADPQELVRDRRWARAIWDDLRPLGLGIGGYVNSMSDEVDDERVLAAYGREKLDRLARIKAEYDPGNVFHRNVNIKPV
ncbi:FAD-linked oxidase [Pseudonocardia sp. EC080610-09]|uniref:FAD-binding oxidoreductase n=1 Tax=unclassified Pseudonocardia TaxID=2619320 RepID=UPI0006CB13CE|nr:MULTISPECIES: FAD-binding oxidoreductase [unclassified Pseudonocardia]ALE73332.1 FAD-linked oxidase [Pseudonocardia sp. EC080625-04]ALL76669.1 FAD-linked oxidase [Pseudonocardia sp. EC080610-09]ALL83697.1 FAD-linked oxidase [Pseudonocardia sp. EC080619-01]